jgi:hypothetical protein
VLGNFLELWTVWTASKTTDALEAGNIRQRIDASISTRIWRTRQVGIFFNDSESTVIVLIAPLSATYNMKEWQDNDFSLCIRDHEKKKNSPSTHTQSPSTSRSTIVIQRPQRNEVPEWVDLEKRIGGVCRKFCTDLAENGPEHLRCILSDILWGWERYVAQMRNDIRGVCSQLRLTK